METAKRQRELLPALPPEPPLPIGMSLPPVRSISSDLVVSVADPVPGLRSVPVPCIVSRLLPVVPVASEPSRVEVPVAGAAPLVSSASSFCRSVRSHANSVNSANDATADERRNLWVII
jgi:hypothetical protein